VKYFRSPFGSIHGCLQKRCLSKLDSVACMVSGEHLRGGRVDGDFQKQTSVLGASRLAAITMPCKYMSHEKCLRTNSLETRSVPFCRRAPHLALHELTVTVLKANKNNAGGAETREPKDDAITKADIIGKGLTPEAPRHRRASVGILACGSSEATLPGNIVSNLTIPKRVR
jgi:hypothetical protein